ncbi:MAG: thioredoxin domain-containing protein [Rhodospirillales bacterium]|nr:thioredoxin domain-containing protein [Rhodospirillales bacterium]
MTKNLLREETSPYLLQHKDNPVHWQAWGEESLSLARKQNKPILLSIGYSACHWCHVMAHESFENDAIAGLMNEKFVNIKVDREERPDIDALYQSALQMMGEQGGWPLTIFLTPAGEPFWGGTYFPSTAKYGRPGFPDILNGLANAYHNDPDRIRKTATAFKQGLEKMSRPDGGGAPSVDILNRIATGMLDIVDTHRGGTNGAPKFPQPFLFRFLWNAHVRQGAGQSPFGDTVTLTLDHICQGGIYDHLGGGFARYSTDEVWLAPHFEKMLYDNALLVELLADVWQKTNSPLYAVRVRETVGWVLRDMRAYAGEDGGEDGLFAFTSAFDADSEGEEGKFCVWNEAEIDAVLGTDAAVFKTTYDVTGHGNWENKVILNRSAGLALGSEEEEAHLRRLREKLLAVRNKRVQPGRDDKVLADWNGLMIAALAKAGAVFDEPDRIAAAETVFRFVVEVMTTDQKTGRLAHTWCDGRVRHPAVVDDYANMARAALMLHGVTGAPGYLARAQGWVDIADAHYWDGDEAGGGYFLSADDTGDVIARSKPVHDNAVPSGNGTMAEVLAWLFYLTGETRYRDRAEHLIKAIAYPDPNHMANQPVLMNAFEFLESAAQVVLIGEADDPATVALLRKIFDAGLDGRIIVQLPPGAALPEGHPAQGKTAVDGKPTVYICRGPVCGLPVTDSKQLVTELKSV